MNDGETSRRTVQMQIESEQPEIVEKYLGLRRQLILEEDSPEGDEAKLKLAITEREMAMMVSERMGILKNQPTGEKVVGTRPWMITGWAI